MPVPVPKRTPDPRDDHPGALARGRAKAKAGSGADGDRPRGCVRMGQGASGRVSRPVHGAWPSARYACGIPVRWAAEEVRGSSEPASKAKMACAVARGGAGHRDRPGHGRSSRAGACAGGRMVERVGGRRNHLPTHGRKRRRNGDFGSPVDVRRRPLHAARRDACRHGFARRDGSRLSRRLRMVGHGGPARRVDAFFKVHDGRVRRRRSTAQRRDGPSEWRRMERMAFGRVTAEPRTGRRTPFVPFVGGARRGSFLPDRNLDGPVWENRDGGQPMAPAKDTGGFSSMPPAGASPRTVNASPFPGCFGWPFALGSDLACTSRPQAPIRARIRASWRGMSCRTIGWIWTFDVRARVDA